MWSVSGSITEAVLWFQTPSSPSTPLPPATVPSLSSFTPPWRPALPYTPSPDTPHMRNRHGHTHARTYASQQSYPMCLLHTDGMPGETIRPSVRTPSVSPRASVSFPESAGVISDGELIINSIKWVWLPRQIGLGYNIIISASSAVTMGHGSQMRVTLIGREDVATVDGNRSEDWFVFVETSE